MTELLTGDLETLRSGATQIISHAGAGQYQIGSPSACGLASLNCARILFEREASGLHGQALLTDMLDRRTTEVRVQGSPPSCLSLG